MTSVLEVTPTLQRKLHALYEMEPLIAHEHVCHFTRQLKCALLPPCEQVYFYHLLLGETPLVETPYLDFPEPFAVQSFIEREFARFLRLQHGPLLQAV